MKKFALITEGITDYLVLKNILTNYFKNDIRINQIQPTIDETDKQTSGGGWTEVIKYCQNNDLNDILEYNDYVVIQIDTDIASEKPLNLQIHNKKTDEIYHFMKSTLLDLMPNKFDIQENFIFAIGIHQIECWLVGLIDNNHSAKDIVNCLNRLNRAIGKTKKYKIIPPDKKENSKETYHLLSSKLKKQKDIIKYSKKNYGFEMFIEQLEKI